MIVTHEPFTDDSFDHDLFKQQCEELSAEAELRHRDYLCGRITWDEFVIEHYSLVAKFEALQRYLIQSHDAEERQRILIRPDVAGEN